VEVLYEPRDSGSFLGICFGRGACGRDELPITPTVHSFERPIQPGYLLGTASNDWNPLQPTWRYWLPTDTMPWLANPVVNGVTVCPGTGMLVMALEAVRQMATAKSRVPTGFMFKDVQFIAPIAVKEDLQSSPEAVVEVRPTQNVHEKNSATSKMLIFSCTGETWKLYFASEVQLEYDELDKSRPEWANEDLRARTDVKDQVDSAFASCIKPIDSPSFYRFCGESGIQYGTSFRLLRDIAWDGRECSTARIDMALATEHHRRADSPVHPAILDAALHLLIAHASEGIRKQISTAVPQKIRSMWISGQMWTGTTNSVRICSFTRTEPSPILGTRGNSYITDDNGSPLCIMRDLVQAEVSSISLTQCDIDRMSGYLKRYVTALKHMYNAEPPNEEEDLSDSQLEILCQECELEHPTWRMFPAVARALPSILRSKADPLEILFSSKAAEEFYVQSFGSLALDERMQMFLDLATHEKPDLKVLEVGAGTGSMTRSILAVLQSFEKKTG
jgi:acyl transferase domain-containing protein